jgi:hypothetical protein
LWAGTRARVSHLDVTGMEEGFSFHEGDAEVRCPEQLQFPLQCAECADFRV